MMDMDASQVSILWPFSQNSFRLFVEWLRTGQPVFDLIPETAKQIGVLMDIPALVLEGCAYSIARLREDERERLAMTRHARDLTAQLTTCDLSAREPERDARFPLADLLFSQKSRAAKGPPAPPVFCGPVDVGAAVRERIDAHSLESVAALFFQHGFFLAGGFVLRSLSHLIGMNPTAPSDADFFALGMSQEEALRALRRLLRAVCLHCAERHAGMLVVRSSRAVTIAIDDLLPLQVILCAYQDADELFSKFDVDCCRVGFDGSRVFLHESCREAIVHGANIVTHFHDSPFLAARLCKYGDVGFAAVIPGYTPPGLALKADALHGAKAVAWASQGLPVRDYAVFNESGFSNSDQSATWSSRPVWIDLNVDSQALHTLPMERPPADETSGGPSWVTEMLCMYKDVQTKAKTYEERIVATFNLMAAYHENVRHGFVKGVVFQHFDGHPNALWCRGRQMQVLNSSAELPLPYLNYIEDAACFTNSAAYAATVQRYMEFRSPEEYARAEDVSAEEWWGNLADLDGYYLD